MIKKLREKVEDIGLEPIIFPNTFGTLYPEELINDSI
jgi:hypothetical protein